MIRFLLNNELVGTEVSEGSVLLDYIREGKKLKGTKSACREGDCGSCTVLLGTLNGGLLHYRAITSCITPMGNIHGKHVVTIEGLNQEKISPIQQALIDSGAIQCGYCTPGIVLSLTGYLLSGQEFTFDSAKNAVAGNICRCTGYKSIERALVLIINQLQLLNPNDQFNQLIKKSYLPDWFTDVHSKLSTIQPKSVSPNLNQIVGGGTDLYVQQADILTDKDLSFISDIPELNQISIDEDIVKIGAACKISELIGHKILNSRIPGFDGFINLIASQQIRNMATIAGNLVNASPIGDLSILLLALEAQITIKSNSGNTRKVKLDEFFKTYKKIDLAENEIITYIEFKIPEKGNLFNFEKVSKRQYLDIASVNSAALVHIENEIVKAIKISVGGVSPIPLFLRETCKFLIGKPLTSETIQLATKILKKEISPISDVRGSAEYKRLLARQLFFAHFLKFFPKHFELKELIG